jgi:DNA-binding MarR family transcriptional regulator
MRSPDEILTRPRPPDGAPLGPALEFLRTLWAVDHGLAGLSTRMKRSIGATGPQRLAIRLIGRSPGIGPAELANLLHVHRSAATGIVQRLEASKLVTRQVHPGDSRRWVLSLTPAGQRIDEDDRGTIEARVRQVLASATPEETAATIRLLDRLAGALSVVD